MNITSILSFCTDFRFVLLVLLVHGLLVPEFLLAHLLLVVMRALVVRGHGRIGRLDGLAASAVPVV